MASYDDQKLIDDIKGVLAENGTTPAGQRVVSTLQTYADNPSPTEQNAQDVRDSLSSLLQISGVISQEKLLKIAALEAMGMNTFFNGIGPIDTDDRDKRDKRQFDQTVRALAVQALQAEAMRQFNEKMEDLRQEMSGLLNRYKDFKRELAEQDKPGGEVWKNDVALITAGQMVTESLAQAKENPTDENLRKAQICLEKLRDSAQRSLVVVEKELKQIEGFDKEFAEKRGRTLDRLTDISKTILDPQAKQLVSSMLTDARNGKKVAPNDPRLQQLNERQAELAKTSPGSNQERQLADLLAMGKELFTNSAELAALREKREQRIERLKEIKELSTKQIEAIDEALKANSGVSAQDIKERRSILAKYADEEARLLDAIREDQNSMSNFQTKSYESVVKRLNTVAQNDDPTLWDITKKYTMGALGALGSGREYEGKTVLFANHQKLYYTLDENNKRVYLPGTLQNQYRAEDKGSLSETILDNTVLPVSKYGSAAIKSAGDTVKNAAQTVKETAAGLYDWAFGSSKESEKTAKPEAQPGIKTEPSPAPAAAAPSTAPSAAPAASTELTPEEMKKLYEPKPGETANVTANFNAANGAPAMNSPAPSPQPEQAPKQILAAAP